MRLLIILLATIIILFNPISCILVGLGIITILLSVSYMLLSIMSKDDGRE